MTIETAQQTIDELSSKPTDELTPAEKGKLTRAQNTIAEAEEAAAEAAAKQAVSATGIAMPKGLYGKLWWVQVHVGHVEKTGRVNFGKANYKHMQEHGLLKVLKPLLEQAQLVFLPVGSEHSRDGNHTFVDVTYRLADIESGDTLDITLPSEGVDSQDKGTNKALTNGMKYALQKVFLIPTEQIDDVEGSDEAHNTASTAGAKAAKKPTERAEKLTARALTAVNQGASARTR